MERHRDPGPRAGGTHVSPPPGKWWVSHGVDQVAAGHRGFGRFAEAHHPAKTSVLHPPYDLAGARARAVRDPLHDLLPTMLCMVPGEGDRWPLLSAGFPVSREGPEHHFPSRRSVMSTLAGNGCIMRLCPSLRFATTAAFRDSGSEQARTRLSPRRAGVYVSRSLEMPAAARCLHKQTVVRQNRLTQGGIARLHGRSVSSVTTTEAAVQRIAICYPTESLSGQVARWAQGRDDCRVKPVFARSAVAIGGALDDAQLARGSTPATTMPRRSTCFRRRSRDWGRGGRRFIRSGCMKGSSLSCGPKGHGCCWGRSRTNNGTTFLRRCCPRRPAKRRSARTSGRKGGMKSGHSNNNPAERAGNVRGALTSEPDSHPTARAG